MFNSTSVSTPEDVYCCLLYNDFTGQNKTLLTKHFLQNQQKTNPKIQAMKDAYTLLKSQPLLSPNRTSIDIILEHSRRTHSQQLETQL